MSMRVRIASTVLALTAAIFVAPSAPASASTDFYTPPADLPAANGALVRTEPMNLGASFSLGGLIKTLPGRATRLLYKSTDQVGDSVAVSGAYIEPAKAWTGGGPRPLVSLSVGTQGTADACAPSKTLEKVLNVEDSKFMVGYEIPAIYRFLNKGVAVVVTDYVGLGTTDRTHTYMNRLDQGHAVLDAARAALALPDTSLQDNSPVGFYGYSQGGAASGSAVELAPTYAPELNIKGAYVGGPPANLYEVMKKIDGTALTGAIAWVINGTVGYQPELAAGMGAILNAEGVRVLEESREQCIAEALLSTGFKKTSKWTQSGQPAAVEVLNQPGIMQAIDQLRIGRLKPTVPTLVLTGTKDDIVEHGQAKQLASDWCAQGANVTYRPVIQLASTGGTMLNHLAPLLSEQGSAANWLVDRLKGRSVRSNCGSLRWLP